MQQEQIRELRQQIDAAIAAHDWVGARGALLRLWQDHASGGLAPYVLRQAGALPTSGPLTPCRVAILRSFTVEPMVMPLRAGALLGGIDAQVRLGDFNSFAQEILDPASWLYTWSPDAIFLAAQTRDIVPGLWDGFADYSEEQVRSLVSQTIAQFEQLVRALRSRSDAPLIIHNLQLPPPALGILDAQRAEGQSAAVGQINAALARLAHATANVYLLDYDGLIARHGAKHWEDLSKWHTMRLPIAGEHLVHLATAWGAYLHPITGRVCKCLVCDLDNTLWGGVIGEDGMDGIALATSGPGAPFWNLQRTILDLHRRGIILAIASKNNPADAREALEKHPGMLLKTEHFAALRANWDDKVTSLRGIAADLNIGVDALAFIDDNPAERDWVRRELPEVTVLELPPDPALFAQTVRAAGVFQRLRLTDEDRERGRMYAEQRTRQELSSSAASLEDFYRSLQMQVEIFPIDVSSAPRAAQLTQKTNQFNLTTRRYSEQELLRLSADPMVHLYAIKVQDRLGDSGLTGVAITRDAADACEIDTLLLSCRIIGRTIETAFLSEIAQQARTRGCTRLIGWFIPTKKNAPASEFYAAHHFTRTRQDGAAVLWELDLRTPPIHRPEWITLKNHCT